MIELRGFKEEDIAQLTHILNDAEVSKYLSTKIPQPYTKQDAHWWINAGSKTGIIKAISKQGLLIGCIGVNRGQFEYERCGEIGYWLAKDSWRQGITKTAIQQMTDFVFSNTNIERIYASVFSENKASMALLLKSGFAQEGILRRAIYKNGQFYDNHIFAKLKQG